MSAQTLGGLAPVRRKGDSEHVEDARDSLVATLAWMTAAAVGRQDRIPTPAAYPAAAESWRTSAGTMTQSQQGQGTTVDGLRADTRVVADVQTDALGAIRLVVERTKTGLSVTVALRAEVSPMVTEWHRTGLQQALLAAGLSVSSVTFVHLNEDGTAFALHDQGSEEGPPGGPTNRVDEEDSRARSSGKRKINTLG